MTDIKDLIAQRLKVADEERKEKNTRLEKIEEQSELTREQIENRRMIGFLFAQDYQVSRRQDGMK